MRTHIRRCWVAGSPRRRCVPVARPAARSIAALTSEHGDAPLARPALLNKPPSGVSRRGHSTAARGGPAHRSRLAAARHGRHARPLASHSWGARHHRRRHDATAPGGAARARDHEVCHVPRDPPPSPLPCRHIHTSDVLLYCTTVIRESAVTVPWFCLHCSTSMLFIASTAFLGPLHAVGCYCVVWSRSTIAFHFIPRSYEDIRTVQ